MIAAICGNACIWKPSEKTPATAQAVQNILEHVIKHNHLPEGLFCLVQGGKEVGEWLAKDTQISLISATGSTTFGVGSGSQGAGVLPAAGNAGDSGYGTYYLAIVVDGTLATSNGVTPAVLASPYPPFGGQM